MFALKNLLEQFLVSVREKIFYRFSPGVFVRQNIFS